jgi:hypothetical protein
MLLIMQLGAQLQRCYDGSTFILRISIFTISLSKLKNPLTLLQSVAVRFLLDSIELLFITVRTQAVELYPRSIRCLSLVCISPC